MRIYTAGQSEIREYANYNRIECSRAEVSTIGNNRAEESTIEKSVAEESKV